MLVAPQYESLDLPVHDPDTFVATAEHLQSPRKFQENVMQDGVSRFVRAALIELLDPEHAPASLTELLKKTDEELTAIAELCDGLVVWHEWGLYPVRGKGYEYARYLPALNGIDELPGLPKNHILVAEVDLIQDPDPSMTQAEMPSHAAIVKEGLHRYFRGGKGSYQLHDMRRSSRFYKPEQFVFGAPADAPGNRPARHLVDIEPRFRLTR